MQLATERRVRILDFDVECRPIAWYGGDFVTKQPTAIAWKWIGLKAPIYVAVIGESDRSSLVLEEEAAMLEQFRAAYDEADLVTGHFIRGFDLPLLNGACERLGLPVLGPKDTQDTKLDYVRASGISKSMENLGAMYELKHPKVQMNTASWGAGNMLLPHGIEATKKRVIGDVREHIELRAEMLRRGVLGPTKPWTGSARAESYHP
jgi:DNA polymerase elongation subunit (family B)